MATENKEKAKGEAIFPLTQEQINQIAAIGAKEGVRAYKEEQKKEERRRKKEDSKVRKTKKLLSSYRRIKATLSDDEQFTPEEQAELRWKFIEDLMGNTREIAGKSERTIKDTERKREEDLYCVFRIEKATEMYREECEKSGSEEAKRRYRELSMMYLDEKPYTVQEISEVENISDKTVYKDIGMQDTWTDTISEILSFLTYGWSFHEIVYKRRMGNTKNPTTKSKYTDGLIGWKKLPIRAQETLYRWEYDNEDNLLGMTQMPPPDFGTYTIPKELVDKWIRVKYI